MTGRAAHDPIELSALAVDLDPRLRALVESFQPAATPLPDTRVHHLIAAHAAQRPDALAVTSPAGNLTYRELEERAAAVAAHLGSRELGPDDLVGVLGERTADFIVAVLGIWQAGAAYLPIDPAWPRARSRHVLRQAGCALVLTSGAPGEAWQATASDADDAAELVAVADLRGPAAGPAAAPAAAPDLGDRDRSGLAYVIFTSGSTGQPKGAMVEHVGMLNHVLVKVHELGLTTSDVVIQNASQAFDISVWQMFAPLVAGGRVHLVGDEPAHDPVLLMREADRAAAAVLEVVPSMLHMILDHLEAAAARPPLASLRWLLATGETLPPELCRRWLALYPTIPVVNAYGPTECSDDVTHHVIATPPDPAAELVPIGRAVANTRLYVMAEEHGVYRLCAPGTEGELFVAGPCVGRGYVNDADTTRKAFFRDPFWPSPDARIYRTGDLVRQGDDGTLEFLGRTDRQLKLRGHRIQPEEIEAALREHPSVKDAVVLLQQDGGAAGEARLVAFVQPHWRNAPTIAGRPRHPLPNGMAIARHTRSEVDFLYADIFERNAYTRHGLAIRPGDTVVDVGGNIGLFSLFAHDQSHGGPIYAFEPVPELFALLRENLRLYDVDARVYQTGLGRTAGSTTITYYPGFSTLSGLHPDLTQDREVALSYVRHRRAREPALAGATEVEDRLIEGLLEDRFQAQTREIALSTLSDFIAENELTRIDFLKINVEGAELDVLAGIRPEHWPLIAQVALEIHDFDGRLDDVQAVLRAQGFELGVDQDWSLEQSMQTNYYVYARRPGLPRGTGAAPAQSRSHQAPILTEAELRELVGGRLPEYMAPSEYRFLERLPLTPTGKVDRRALMAQEQAAVRPSADAVAPRTELERALAGIWADVLGQPAIGIHDNFFDRGGHSLLGARVLARVRSALGPELPLRSVFEHPTIASLAAVIEQVQAAAQ